MPLQEATEISEPPGQGLRGTVAGHTVRITSREAAGQRRSRQAPISSRRIAGGLECVVVIDDRYAATLPVPRRAARREPCPSSSTWARSTSFKRVMIVSGDRESEVRYLAEQVGITEVYAETDARREAGDRPRRDRARPGRCTWATASTTPRR